MVGILHRGIMNAKSIYHNAKDGVSVVMDPHNRRVLYGMIPKWSHMCYQFLISDDPGLFDSIYALFDAHVDPPLVVYQCIEVLRTNDFLWDNFLYNTHELRVW